MNKSLSYLSLFKGFSFSKLLESVIPKLPENALVSPKIPFVAPKMHLITASLVINMLSLALPVLTLQVYDRLLFLQNEGTLQVLAAGVIVAIILDVILRLFRSYVTVWAGAAYEHALSCNAMRHILNSDLVELNKDGVATHLQRMTSILKLREFMSGSALVTIIDLPFVFVFLGLIAWLAGWLVLVPIVLLCIFAGISVWLGARLKLALKEHEGADRVRLGYIIETLEGIHALKSMALEKTFQRRFEYVQKSTSSANLDLGRLNAEAVMMGTLFAQIMMVAVIASGTPMALEGSITMGTLIACVLLAGRVTQPVQRTLGLWVRYQDFLLAHEDVKKTFSLPILKRVDPRILKGNQGRVEIKDLSFSYGNEVLLRNVDLDLMRGDVVTITGPRGSGKTTLLKLMAGLYKPTGGDLLIDGVQATKYPARELVRHVGFLPMEGMIFRGTIWENLSAFGEYGEDAIHEMIRLLDLEDAIKQLPSGYDTKLEGGQSDLLPPGLRQRLAIARALMPKPRVILFDNADRGLDRGGYNTVYRLLARLKKRATMVIVSDDINIARLANRSYIITAETLIEKQSSSVNADILPYQELRL